MTRVDVPDFFVYGEPSRSLDVGFLHIETVMQRRSLHFGRVAAHKHALMGQITYWYEGGGLYRLEDQSWSFSAPAVSFVPSGVVHGFDVEAESDAIVVSISDDLLRALAPQLELGLHAPIFLRGEAGDAAWGRLGALVHMAAAIYREGEPSERILAGLISVMLSMIGRLGGAAILEVEPSRRALGQALRRAIDARYKENRPVDHYAAALGTTPHLLDKAARALFGRSVKDAILERRILEAKRLLKFTIRPVEDIGREIGFADPAYFSRFFRGRTGESPAAWRRRRAEGGP